MSTVVEYSNLNAQIQNICEDFGKDTTKANDRSESSDDKALLVEMKRKFPGGWKRSLTFLVALLAIATAVALATLYSKYTADLKNAMKENKELQKRLDNYAPQQLAKKYEDVKTSIAEHFEELKALKRDLNAIYRTDCSKIESGKRNESSNIHEIFVSGRFLPVSCDLTTGGGGWTVIQRRMDGSEDFYRNHADYVKGFGNVTREFWLGLDNIYNILQSAKNFKLRIDMEDWDGETRFAQYSHFDISGSTGDYTLSVAGYSGNAGDSLTKHNGSKFSTKDRDVDTYPSNCAQLYKGAWWYFHCHASNLNGLYHVGGPHAESYADGVNWYDWKGHNYSLKIVEMKIKPVSN